MRQLRFALPLFAVITVIATAGVGLMAGAVWAITVATAGTLLSVLLLGWILVKNLQTVLARLTGLIKQSARVATVLENAARDTAHVRHVVGTDSSKPSGEMKRVLEDLSLASRSLTVPQAHFDQLLRSVSANTIRTEAALDDAVEEIRLLMTVGDAGKSDFVVTREESGR